MGVRQQQEEEEDEEALNLKRRRRGRRKGRKVVGLGEYQIGIWAWGRERSEREDTRDALDGVVKTASKTVRGCKMMDGITSEPQVDANRGSVSFSWVGWRYTATNKSAVRMDDDWWLTKHATATSRGDDSYSASRLYALPAYQLVVFFQLCWTISSGTGDLTTIFGFRWCSIHTDGKNLSLWCLLRRFLVR